MNLFAGNSKISSNCTERPHYHHITTHTVQLINIMSSKTEDEQKAAVSPSHCKHLADMKQTMCFLHVLVSVILSFLSYTDHHLNFFFFISSVFVDTADFYDFYLCFFWFILGGSQKTSCVGKGPQLFNSLLRVVGKNTSGSFSWFSCKSHI